MVKQEQVTITIITIVLIALSLYFLVDFYINAPLYDIDQSIGISQAATTFHEFSPNIDTNSNVEIVSK